MISNSANIVLLYMSSLSSLASIVSVGFQVLLHSMDRVAQCSSGLSPPHRKIGIFTFPPKFSRPQKNPLTGEIHWRYIRKIFLCDVNWEIKRNSVPSTENFCETLVPTHSFGGRTICVARFPPTFKNKKMSFYEKSENIQNILLTICTYDLEDTVQIRSVTM